MTLLHGERHPVPDFGIESGFQFQIDGHMQQRAAGTDEQPVVPQFQGCVAQDWESRRAIGFPDVVPVNHTEREAHVLGQGRQHLGDGGVSGAEVEVQAATLGVQRRT